MAAGTLGLVLALGLAMGAAKLFWFEKDGRGNTSTSPDSTPVATASLSKAKEEDQKKDWPKKDSIPAEIGGFGINTQPKTREEDPKNDPVSADDGEFGVAVSLRELKTQIDTEDAKRLFGATRLLGFLLTEDERGKDCILIFAKERDRPSLKLGDLAVAYRNVKTGPDRPACTFDLRPDTLTQLGELAQKLAAAREPSEVPPLVKKWEEIASSPREVQVFHVEADNSFAKTMVEADYLLKSIVDGTASVSGITSFPELLVDQVKDEITRTGKIETRLTASNRFMLNPGRLAYRTDGELYLLTSCEVILLTEEAAIQKGRSSGTGTGHPLAKRFADVFTGKFADIAKAKPVFRDLENLYRALAIASLIQAEGKRPDIADIVDGAFGTIEISKEKAVRTLPGRGMVKKVEGKAPGGGYVLWLPSCGGVSMDIQAENMKRETEQNKETDPKKETRPKRKAAPAEILRRVTVVVISKRPGARSVTWTFRLEPGLEIDVVTR